MIVKVAISFITKAKDTELIKKSFGILNAMMGNPNFPDPNPTLVVVTAALSEFSTAQANTANGGKVFTAIKDAKRVVLEGCLQSLAAYVQKTCAGNMAILLDSGFPTQKPYRTPANIPATPWDLYVSLGALTGELDSVMTPVPGTVVYNWQIFEASAPMVMVQSAQTTAARNTFGGLRPGVIYSIQVNAVNSAGTSNWSNPISKMVV